MIGIPKRLGHIWIGPHTPPHDTMQTYLDHHPDWEYTLYDNNFLATFPFRTHIQIREYLLRGNYEGVADLMRYEILYAFGGFLPEADSHCIASTTHLFERQCAYTVFENEFLSGQQVSPIFACEPGNSFLRCLIDTLSKLRPKDLHDPVRSTGNMFVARSIRSLKPDIEIFPSHYFIPWHLEGELYTGPDRIYAVQYFGTTTRGYKRDNTFPKRLIKTYQLIYKAKNRPNSKQRLRLTRAKLPEIQTYANSSNRASNLTPPKLKLPNSATSNPKRIAVIALFDLTRSQLQSCNEAIGLNDELILFASSTSSDKQNDFLTNCSNTRLVYVESTTTNLGRIRAATSSSNCDIFTVLGFQHHLLPHHLNRIRSIELMDGRSPDFGFSTTYRKSSFSWKSWWRGFFEVSHHLEVQPSSCLISESDLNSLSHRYPFGTGLWFNRNLPLPETKLTDCANLLPVAISINWFQQGKTCYFDASPGIVLDDYRAQVSLVRLLDDLSNLIEDNRVFFDTYPNLFGSLIHYVQDTELVTIPYFQLQRNFPKYLSIRNAFKASAFRLVRGFLRM